MRAFGDAKVRKPQVWLEGRGMLEYTRDLLAQCSAIGISNFMTTLRVVVPLTDIRINGVVANPNTLLRGIVCLGKPSDNMAAVLAEDSTERAGRLCCVSRDDDHEGPCASGAPLPRPAQNSTIPLKNSTRDWAGLPIKVAESNRREMVDDYEAVSRCDGGLRLLLRLDS